jgi:hypothetical protein
MLDSVVLRHYLSGSQLQGHASRYGKQGQGRRRSNGALGLFRHNLQSESVIDRLREQLALVGFALTPICILKLLVWTQVEPAGD